MKKISKNVREDPNKIFDYNPVPTPNNKPDELPMPKMSSNDPILEPRFSSLSNQRFMVGEERGIERPKHESFPFAFNEEEQSNLFINKEAPDSDFVSPFARNQSDNEQVFREENRNPGREFLMRQDSSKFSASGVSDIQGFGNTNNNFNNLGPYHQNSFSSYQNFENPNNYQFGQYNSSFKSDYDLNDPIFNRPMQPTSSFNNYASSNIDFKFSNPNMMNQRMKYNDSFNLGQPGYNNMFMEQNRGNQMYLGNGLDYPPKMMNSSNQNQSKGQPDQNQPFNRMR